MVEPDPAPTTPLTLDQTTLNLNQAETATLTVTGAEDVLWTSSDTNVATVDDTGLVTAGIPGTATITVTTADGSQSAACTVNVATPLPGAARGEAGPALYLSEQGRDHQRVLRQGRLHRPDARGRHGADRHLDH